jgi:transcriptional regulator with PAS, ATPase and Fis domain
MKHFVDSSDIGVYTLVMISILLIAPFQGFADQFREIFEEHNAMMKSGDYDTQNYSLDIIIAGGIEEIGDINFSDKVIVARGFLARALQRKEYYVPVVEVPVASADLVQVLQQARKLHNCRQIAVIGAKNMIMGVEKLSEIFNMDIRQYTLRSRDQIPEAVRAIKESGIKVIVGGVSTCQLAKQLGLHGVMLESSRESIWYSITEAKRLAFISRQEMKKSQNLKVIFDNISEGIIALDKDNRIEVLNHAASRILALPSLHTMGKPVLDIIPGLQEMTLKSAESREQSEIISNNKGVVTVSCAPIMIEGENLGRILILQESSRIQALETKIRQKIYSRGHIARHTFEDIIGYSQRIREITRIAKKYSQVDSNILIEGETGTGKELFTQSIHNYSHRKSGPFVAVNCAALSESLLESELFGYVEGAFTGAVKGGKPGVFELAHRGTLFLDEISEIPSQLQGRLLRAIQEREIRRLGDERVIPVDVRIISASNRNLQLQVNERKFREDLYYRLDILKLSMPPLRERKDDIPMLLDYWVKYFSMQFKMKNTQISENAKTLLSRYAWPGNIRELRNICERLVVLCQCPVIDVKDVELVLNTAELQSKPAPRFLPEAESEYTGIQAEMEQLEKEHILGVLRDAGFNKNKAAVLLGMSRTTLWRRLRKLEQAETVSKR